MPHLVNKKLVCLAVICGGCGILARLGSHWYEAKVLRTLNSELYNKAECDAESLIKQIKHLALQTYSVAYQRHKVEQEIQNVSNDDEFIMSIYVNNVNASRKSAIVVVYVIMSIFEMNGWTLNYLYELYCVLRQQYLEHIKEKVNEDVSPSHKVYREETNYLYLLTCNVWNCLSALLYVKLFLYVFEDALCDDCERATLMETINTHTDDDNERKQCAIVHLPSIELEHIMSRDDVIILLSIAKVLVHMYPWPIESDMNDNVYVHELDKKLIQKARDKEKHDSSRWYTMWLFTRNVLEMCGWRTLVKVIFLSCTQRELFARLAPDYDVECVNLCGAELVNAQANCNMGKTSNGFQQSFASFIHENVTHKAGRLIAVSILLRVISNIVWSSRVTFTSVVLTPYYNKLTLTTLLNLSRQDYVPSERWRLPLHALSALQYVIEFCTDDISWYLSELIMNLDYLQTWRSYFIATTATWLVQNTYSFIEECWIRARIASDYVNYNKQNDVTIAEEMENVKIENKKSRTSIFDKSYANSNTEQKIETDLLESECIYHYGLAVLLYTSMECYEQNKVYSAHNRKNQEVQGKVLFLDSSHLPQLTIRLPTKPVSALKLTYQVCNALLDSEFSENECIINETATKDDGSENNKHTSNSNSNSDKVDCECSEKNSSLYERNRLASVNNMDSNNCTEIIKHMTACKSELTSIMLNLSELLSQKLQSNTSHINSSDESLRERAKTSKCKRQERNNNNLRELRLNGCESKFYKPSSYHQVSYNSCCVESNDILEDNDMDLEHIIDEKNADTLLTQIMSAIFSCFNIVPIIATIAFHDPSREHNVETSRLYINENNTVTGKHEVESVAPQIARIYYSATTFDWCESNVPISWWNPISPYAYRVEVEKSKHAFCNSYASNWKIVDKVCHSKPHIDRLLSHETIPLPLNGAWKVTFDHVSFRYPSRKRNVLTDISFTVESGSSLGIIGFSGSGKTTILLLITRFYLPVSGTICINDIPIERFSVRELRRRIGHAWQSANEMRFLQNSTIEANVALATINTHVEIEGNDQFLKYVQEPNKTWMENKGSVEQEHLCRGLIRNNVNTALSKAQALNFVNARACGVSNVLDCSEYSGGELERINIARCFAQNEESKGLYLLDECTNALDSSTENKIINSLHGSQPNEEFTKEEKHEFMDKLKRGTILQNFCKSEVYDEIYDLEYIKCKKKRHVTVIITSHRLSTIRNCAEIIVLNKGIIVERGSWETLSTQKGHTHFNKLLKLQTLAQKTE